MYRRGGIKHLHRLGEYHGALSIHDSRKKIGWLHEMKPAIAKTLHDKGPFSYPFYFRTSRISLPGIYHDSHLPYFFFRVFGEENHITQMVPSIADAAIMINPIQPPTNLIPED